LRERSHDTIRATAELGDNPNPALRTSLAKEALASRSGVWFAMIWCPDRGHRLCKVLAHLDMLVEHMIPRHVVHLDEMVLGIANLSDDMALSDALKTKSACGRKSASPTTSTTKD
jgi:hypothetical protein